ncbi:MAG: sulfatase-like hydrolase/transferase [Sandaracinaceae bacterium]
MSHSDEESAETAENDATLQDYGPPAAMVEDMAQEAAASLREADAEEPAEAPKKPEKSPLRKALSWALKIGVSLGGLYLVYGKALGRDGMEELSSHIDQIQWGWFGAAAAMQMTAIGFAVVRWRMLLGGQGIRAKWSFLVPSFMIGRFWGAFTPGGLGLDGWRLYDVATHSKKPARAVAVTAVEKILGQLAFGLVVVGASLWGLELMGVEGVLMINAFFVVLVSTGLTFIAKPALFQPLFKLLPAQVQPKIKTLVDAVSAYHGKFRLLATAVLCGAGVHAFNNMIYVCAAQAMQLPVTPTVVFFASSIVIMSTMVPLSLNGVGLREATAAGVLGAFGGVSAPIAAATYTLGWIAEMCVSSLGVPIYLARKASFDAQLVVEDHDREERIHEEMAAIPESAWPKKARGAVIGAGAGLLAGMLIGFAEGGVIVQGGAGTISWSVMAYGAVVYAVFCALGGGAAGLVFAQAGRWMKREAVPEADAFARMTGLIIAAFTFALAVFRIRRDVFHEELALKSKEGLMVLGGCALAAAALYFVFSFLLRQWTSRKAGSWMLRAWGTPALVGLLIAGMAGAAQTIGQPTVATAPVARADAPSDAPNILFIVVDTLRADHLPTYGYDEGSTPNVDRFMEDAVRYNQAFANASWTRPSFASIMTGRYPSSHGVMAKSDALPDEVVTMAEALQEGGYETGGIVTNFNVEPRYNFHQGFDDYRFLETENVLWADAAGAQLLFIQLARRVVEKGRAAFGGVQVESFYQDAPTVNRELLTSIDAAPEGQPWFRFVGYMDPHDPYFEHPYNGVGYSRAAHQEPDPEDAERLRGLYDGEITYWDEHFGQLMDDLRERGLYDDTLIVIPADHGEEFHEHGGFWHGTTLYDEQVHVPLLVKLPGNERAGTHVSHWVQSIDLMPSVLRRVGLEVPEGVQGGSIEEGTTRVFAEESHEGNVLASVRELRNFEELKIITANEGNPRGLEPVEMYRVADDIGEQNNVADENPESTRGMVSTLGEAREAAAEGAVEGVSVERTEEEMRQLCQLGYQDASDCCDRGYLTGSACDT